MSQEQIYEAGEYCEKCLGVEKVGRWKMPNSETLGFDICQVCWDDAEGLKIWFTSELEETLAASGEYEKLPSGKWKRIEKQ